MKLTLRTYSLKLAVKAPGRVSLTVRRANVPTLNLTASRTIVLAGAEDQIDPGDLTLLYSISKL